MTVQYIDRTNTFPPLVVYNVMDFESLLTRKDVVFHAEKNLLMVYV